MHDPQSGRRRRRKNRRAKYCTTYASGDTKPRSQLQKFVSRLTFFCTNARSTSGTEWDDERIARAKYCTTYASGDAKPRSRLQKFVSRLTFFLVQMHAPQAKRTGMEKELPCKILHDPQAKQRKDGERPTRA